MDSYNEKTVGVTTTVGHSTNSSDVDSLRSPLSRPPLWPEEPGPLTKPKAALWTDILYDVGLVLVPIALIVKIILCIVAQHIDRNAVGSEIDLVSSLTLNLLKVNAQVCPTRCCCTYHSQLLAYYSIHNCLRIDRLYFGSTSCVVARAERSHSR